MWHQSAVLYLNGGRPEEALAALKHLQHVRPKKAEWHVAAARAHQELKQNAGAAEDMARAYALTKDPEQLYQCAVFRLDADQPAQALPLLKQLTEMPGPRPQWFVALANALKGLKKKEETAEAMERAASLGRDPELSFRAAWLWLDADRPQKALALLKKLSERKNPRVEWLVALANTYMALNQTRAAAVAMDRVAELDPRSDYLYNAGVLWLHAGQPEKALQHLLTLCRRSPAKADWFVALAHAWLARKGLGEAARAMECAAALSKDPEHAYQAGLIWLQARKADDALRLLIPLCNRPHPNADWLASLVNTHVALKQMGEAETALKRLIDRYPEDPATWRLAVWLKVRQADYGEAAAAMAIAVRLGPPDPDALKELSDLYRMAGVPVKAAAIFQKTWKERPPPKTGIA